MLRVVYTTMVALAMVVAVTATGHAQITAANWTEKVGFKPEASPAGFKAGAVIDKSNVASVKALLPGAIETLVSKYALKLWLTSYKPIHPSKGYIEATNKYLGQAKAIDTGSKTRERGLENYTAGLPFPDPKNGTEVAWNFLYAYNGDDGKFHYGVYWISAKTGVERWEEWVWEFIIRTIHRTDIDPIPAYDALKEKDIQYLALTYAVQPFDKRGFGAVYRRYLDPKDQEGWVYMPSMRRAIQMKIGSTGEAWNSTDMLYEDVRGYLGYVEWMNWKLIEKKTILAPMHAGAPVGKEARDKVFDFNTWPHWNPKLQWEPRPVYVVEATPKFKSYPYSKMIMYIDAETFYIPIKENYDRKGNLWKVVINAYNDSKDMNSGPVSVATSLTIDLQAEHASAFPSYNFNANVGLKPGRFNKSTILKMGK